MKTLAGYTILYDAECPMCNLYTQAFISTGMLDNAGRAPYQQMPVAACPLVDRQRAMNEIALVNTQTGEVTYGIQSIFKVIGNAFPVFGPLFKFGPFAWLMGKIYAIISYNRRVIVPAVADNIGLQPTFKLHYRLVWLLFTCLATGAILTQYAAKFTELMPLGGTYREYIICGSQVFFQGLIISLYRPAKRWDYLGNMMSISFGGALLLLPVLIAGHFMLINVWLYLTWFFMVVGCMLLEHIRRSELLGLGWVLTISWVAYRLGVLLLILYFN